nr:uncharacterized protein LOC109413836 isoform X1 [Aedes albopictus]
MVSQHGAGGQRLCPADQKSVSDVLRRSGLRTTVPVRCASFRLVQGRRTRFRVSFTFCGVKERQRTNLNLLQVGDFLLSPRRARKQRDWHRRLVSVKRHKQDPLVARKPDRQHVHRTHRGRRTRAQRRRKRGRPHLRFSNQRSIEKPLYRVRDRNLDTCDQNPNRLLDRVFLFLQFSFPRRAGRAERGRQRCSTATEHERRFVNEHLKQIPIHGSVTVERWLG